MLSHYTSAKLQGSKLDSAGPGSSPRVKVIAIYPEHDFENFDHAKHSQAGDFVVLTDASLPRSFGITHVQEQVRCLSGAVPASPIPFRPYRNPQRVQRLYVIGAGASPSLFFFLLIALNSPIPCLRSPFSILTCSYCLPISFPYCHSFFLNLIAMPLLNLSFKTRSLKKKKKGYFVNYQSPPDPTSLPPRGRSALGAFLD